MKKIVILFTVIIMAVLFAVSASAATEGYYTYEVKNGEATITDVDTAISGNVTIPSTLGGYPVTIIGLQSFEDCKNLKSITIPEGVTHIRSYAFADCSSLKSIAIPDSVIDISYSVFSHCDSLKSITIPKGVTSISAHTFTWCNNITSITVDIDNKCYSSDSDGVLFNKAKTELIKYPAGNTKTSFVIPDSVTTIGYYAFSYCESLRSITIHDSITSIGVGAFSGCDKLKSITIPDGITAISDDTFFDCDSLTSVTIPDSVTSIGDYAFCQCYSLKSITIPDGVTYIGDKAFSHCDSLTSIVIPDSVTSIGEQAFYSCDSLKKITVGENNKYYSSEDDGVLFDKEKTFLIKYLSSNTRTTYTIPGSVTTIAECAFFNSALVNITIPISVVKINDDAFGNCYIRDVYYEGTEEQWKNIEFGEGHTLKNKKPHFSINSFNHKYTSTVTAPTCKDEGYTTYVCTCGVSYKSDYVSPTWQHSGSTVSEVVSPTCEGYGYTYYICDLCGCTYSDDYKNPTGHNYDGDNCKVCGESKVENCNCKCHRSGISAFFFKIGLFFQKLFGKNKVCACGMKH